MKVAFITDQHFDERSRFEETCRIHNWIAEDAAARGCTLTLLGGDLFEHKSTPAERNAVAAWLQDVAVMGAVVGVYGNHENPDDLDLFNRLRSRHPIKFVKRPEVVLAEGCAIGCVPWPRREHLRTLTGDAGSEQVDQTGQQALQAILRGLGDQLAGHDGPRVLLAHLQTDGCRTSTGQELIGGAISVGLADLALARAHFTAMGHIHLGPGNEWDVDGAPAAYGGSPRRCTFGEPEIKSYTVIEFNGPHLVGWERIPTPCAAMLLLSAQWTEDGLDGLDGVDFPAGAEVRLRYQCPADQRDAARADARRWADAFEEAGAASVKLEEQLTVESRSRAPEVAQAKTLSEKLEALWAARKFDPGERRASLLGKVAELEGEVSHAV